MKKLLALTLTLMMLLAAVPALAAGELVMYSPNSDGLLSIIPLFEEKYDVKVTVEALGTGDALKRIAAEAENPVADLLYGGSLANYMSNKDLFQDYLSSEDANLMEAYRNIYSFITTYTVDGSVLLVNTDICKDLGVEVKGYADLLNPALKGKIATANPATSSSAFCQLTNMLLAMGGYESEEAWTYVKELFTNIEGKITSGSSAVYKGVYNGEYAVGLTYEDPCVTLLKDGAANIQIIYPVEGTVFLPAQIGIVKNAKNIDNAKLFVDFMLTEEAQKFLGENTTSRPVRDVEYTNAYMKPMSEISLIYEDSDYVIEHTQELKDKVQDIITDI